MTSAEPLADFAGQVSHDLKNPLAAISMSIEMAREEVAGLGLVDEPLPALLVRAERAAGRMRDMIDALHAYALAGTAEASEPVDLAAVVAEIDPAVPARGLPTVEGDPDQVRLLMANLLSNAARFGREGVTPTVTVAGQRVGDHWRVEVLDDGRGVPEEERERVFEPMVRLDKAVPGTGVGLATCRRIVDAHGGRIGLSEAPGGGTVAWFELPYRTLPV